ncbi:hypothetical protein Lfu02_59550 [Longispora fulva]|uniref:EF-hand domain-containing protein n=1 Tax=Longispora fulva TaxID=619741 RepID=A0A8J7GII2_9ACTN|nr:caspase family protein [Longispora fulva]MBG6137063.1 hypothetical protein [Longispora fulva]GIG61583.1 hypothetical protein Lfu02_59550 [Longispora fulva]
MAKRALIIANSRYEDPRFRPLPGAAADLTGLRAVLADPAICGFDVAVVPDGRTDEIRIAIQRFFAAAGRDDILLLHVSAHGRRDESRWYFAAANTQYDYLDATGVSFEFIDQRIDRGLSRRVIVLLDCCYSGAATLRRTRGEPVADLSDQFNGRGRVVITSSTALQYAHEEEVTSATPGRPSVFTEAVITGLATGAADLDGDGYVSVDELYDYVHAEVTSRIPEQTPTRTADQVEGRLLLARTPPARRPPRAGRPREAGRTPDVGDEPGTSRTPVVAVAISRPVSETPPVPDPEPDPDPPDPPPGVDPRSDADHQHADHRVPDAPPNGTSLATTPRTASTRTPTTPRPAAIPPAATSPRDTGFLLPAPVSAVGHRRTVASQLLSGVACGVLSFAAILIPLRTDGRPLTTVLWVAAVAGLVGHLAVWVTPRDRLAAHRGPALVLTAAATGAFLIIGPVTVTSMCVLLLLVGVLSALRAPFTAAAVTSAGPGAHSVTLLGQLLGSAAVLLWTPESGRTVVVFSVPVDLLTVAAVLACLLYVGAAGLAFTSAPVPGIPGRRLAPRSRVLVLAAATAELSWGATVLLMSEYREGTAVRLISEDADPVVIVLLTVVAALVPAVVLSRLGGRARSGLVATLAVLGLVGQAGFLYGVGPAGPMASDLLLFPALTLFAALTVGAAAGALRGPGSRDHEHFTLARARGLAGVLGFLPVLYPTAAGTASESIVDARVAVLAEAWFVAAVAVAVAIVLWLARRPAAAGRVRYP